MCFSCLSPCGWCKTQRGMMQPAENLWACSRIFSRTQHQWLARDILQQLQGVFLWFFSFQPQCCCLFSRHVYMSFEVSHLWLPFRNDLRTNLRLKSEKAIKKWKKQAKIHTEIWANSDKIGIEKPVPAFQSRIASGQNLMSKNPKKPLFPVHY